MQALRFLISNTMLLHTRFYLIKSTVSGGAASPQLVMHTVLLRGAVWVASTGPDSTRKRVVREHTYVGE